MNPITRRRCLLGTAFLAVPWRAAWSQTARVPTVTRLVKVFLDLESQLLQAQRGGDAAALQPLLADDFEMRVARRPGTPIPRAEWLAAVDRRKPPEAVIEQMAAHEHGAVVDVSFLLRPTDAQAGAPLFVVDTWAKDGPAWRLKVRYAAPVGTAALRVPGEGEADEAPIRKKY